MFDALKNNESLEDLSMANTTLGDFAAANLACSVESNKALEKINIESNNVSPQTLVKLFEVIKIRTTSNIQTSEHLIQGKTNDGSWLKIPNIFLYRQQMFNKCYLR